MSEGIPNKKKGKSLNKSNKIYPRRIGINYSIKREKSDSQSSNSQGQTKRTHWRRGHWRYQPYGKNRELIKMIRIDPILVNG